MRGYYEESPEKTAGRELERAAERFAGKALLAGYGDLETERVRLLQAALAYAEAVKPKRKRSA